MPIQRACGAENQAGDNTSNGPPRVQSNAGETRRVFCNAGYASVAGDFLYGFERTGGTENELYTAAFRSASVALQKN